MNLKYQTALLLISWLIVQTGLYLFFGVNAALESLKYIGAAQNLLEQGQLPETRYYFYLSTTLLIAFCLKTGLGYGGVVIIQLLLNLAATATFFKALVQVQQKKHSAFFTVLALISFVPYQSWNFYLYTESVFYSCALFFFSACIRNQHLTRNGLLSQGLLLFLVIIARPLGIIFLPCWILYVAYKKKIRPILVAALFLLGLTLAVTVINMIMQTIGDWEILSPAEFGFIICGIPSRAPLNLAHLKQHSPIVQAAFFVLRYPGEFFRLCAARLHAFFFLTRSYYSAIHNLYLLFYAALFSLPFLLSFVFRRKSPATKQGFYLSFLIVLGFTIAIVLQCDDYHNRFHHAIVPVFLFGGLFHLLEKSSRLNRLKQERN